MNPQKKKLGKFVHLNPKLKIGGANALNFPTTFSKRIKVDNGEVGKISGANGLIFPITFTKRIKIEEGEGDELKL